MEAISFILSGKTACFRKPDVNQYAYFTYNNIHKPLLLGMLGAIIGLKGYTKLHDENRGLKKGQLGFNDGYPEYYEKLKDLEVSIVPLAHHGYFSKKLQVFNNSVGYASKEEGGNLIVREQWIEDPKWQVIIKNNDSKEYQDVKNYLEKGKCVYIPYLGKNDHPANISEIKPFELNEPIEKEKISSLFDEDVLSISKLPPKDGGLSYFFKEVSPVTLQQEYHFYEYKNLIFTNHKIKEGDYNKVYSNDGKNYFFI